MNKQSEAIRSAMMQAHAESARTARRLKIYAYKASMEGRMDIGQFLAALSAALTAQANRLFNLSIGGIDKSSDYLRAIFKEELPAILDTYRHLINEAETAGATPEARAVGQLLRANLLLSSLYSPEQDQSAMEEIEKYQVCRFCGYIAVNTPPPACPVCGAAGSTFKEVS